MKLYYSPNSCAIEIGALLGEAGAAFEPVKVDTRGDEQHGAAYRALNAKGKVPTLVRDDGSVLTEWPAIALWIARAYPAAALWPDEPEAEARALEVTSYVVGTLHGQAFRRMFFPHEFCKDEAHRDAVRADGRAKVEAGFAVLAAALGERPYVAGARFGVADAAIFYPTRWAGMYDVALPPAIAALAERVGARPAFADAVATLV